MATITVSTDQDYSALGAVDDDLIIINSSARLTIDESTADIRRWDCITDGEFFIENLTNTPRFVHVSSTGGTPRIRLEAGGKMTARGQLIEVGTSDGSAGQTFTLPTDGAEEYEYLGGVWIDDGAGGHIQFARATAGITGALFGDERLGRQFEHDLANNRIEFGDGTNGWIPPNGRKIYVPSIQIKNTNSNAAISYFDLALSGRLDWEYVSLSCESQVGGGSLNTDFDNGAGQRWRYVCVDLPSGQVNFNINAGLLDLDMVVCHTPREVIMSSCAVPFEVGTLYIYNEHTSNNEYTFEANNIPGGTIAYLTMIAPNRTGGSASRGALISTGANLTVDLIECADVMAAMYFGGGASNILVRELWVNGKGSRTQTLTTTKTPAVRASNAKDITVLDVNSWPQTEADGGFSHREAVLMTTVGCQRVRMIGVDFHSLGDGVDHIINDQGANTELSNVEVTGQIKNRVHELGTTSAGLITRNLTVNDVQSVGTASEFGLKSRYERAYMHASLSTGVGTGADSTSHLTYRNEGDVSLGRVSLRMGPIVELTDHYEVVVQTGKIAFNQNNRLYIENVGDIIRLLGNEHRGVLTATSATKWGVTTGAFTIRFRLRRPGGAWTVWRSFSIANQNTAINELPADTDNGVQWEWEIEKTVAGFTQYLYEIYSNVTLDPLYVEPVVALPSNVTLTGLKDETEVRIFDAANPSVEIGGVEQTSGSWSVPLDGALYPQIIVHVMALGWQMVRLLSVDITGGDLTIPIQQQLDRQFV